MFQHPFVQGARDSVPMMVGIIPFGIIYGTLASAAGLSPWLAVGMSLLVYAGSAQFIALSLIGASAGSIVLLVTTFIVNLRHVLYSATLQPFIAHLPQRWRLLLAFLLTDETFAVVEQRYRLHGNTGKAHLYFLGVGLILYGSWVGSSWIGILFGQAIPNMAGWGLEFAMLATFIGIVVPLLRNWPTLAAAVVAGSVGVITIGWPYKLGLLAAVGAGIVVGVWLERSRSISCAEVPS
ncbi:4-azaleucine resistance transporter AzlC [Pseudomonas duriflava]|uniref:4-azaleucine resistance transporter AzlC n=1 Tax=Pseudomonas duriflava TaxID=459528 RepID=A0A562QFU5_9PSED|nr:AzlC family ABC transporter permease [Pseudomonas duriflava]TWI55632.1 4-azaleucine resistance transporter AzlC [Pseudomonas duriflava]